MKVPISEARRTLPELVRRVKADEGLRVLITVHGEVVAELRWCAPEPPPGAAARRLRQVIERLPASTRGPRDVSGNVNEALYGSDSE